MDEHDRALCEHYGKMLGLKPGWEVSRVELSTQMMKLELGVEWVNAGAICAECGKKCTRHDLAPERRWRHLDAMGFETQIVSRTPRANCGEHGIHQMKVPWAGKHSRFTLAFEALAIKVFAGLSERQSGLRAAEDQLGCRTGDYEASGQARRRAPRFGSTQSGGSG